MKRSDLTSLSSDIQKVLDSEQPWYVAKRSYHDPHRLLQRAQEALEEAIALLEEQDEEIEDMEGKLKDLEEQLTDLENEVARER